MKHLTEDHQAKDTATYDNWVASDCSKMTWLFSNMDEKVSASVMPKKYGIP